MKHTVDELVLDNGARGLLVDIPDATVLSLELNFRAGDFQSPKGKWEVAHVLEHMVLGANDKFPKARKFNAEFTKNGAYSNASTSAYDLNYITECADFEWQRIVNLLLTAVQTPLLPRDEFDAEVGNVREELTGDLNHHFRQLLISARQTHGLMALSDTERLEQLGGITHKDIKDFYKRTHRSDNLRFVLTGKIGGRLKEIDSLFSNLTLKRGERIALPKESPKKLDKVHYMERPGLKNIYFLWHTFAARELEQKELDAMKLVNVMLTETLHSRILGTAREQGLAYDLMSHFNMFKDLSDWWFGAEIRAENVLKVFEITRGEIARIQAGKIDDEDIEAAKQFVIGRHQRSVQTPRSLMKLYSNEYFFNGEIKDNNAFESRVRGVTKQEMVDVVRTMFADKVWGLSVLGTDQQILSEKMHNKLQVLWK